MALTFGTEEDNVELKKLEIEVVRIPQTLHWCITASDIEIVV